MFRHSYLVFAGMAVFASVICLPYADICGQELTESEVSPAATTRAEDLAAYDEAISAIAENFYDPAKVGDSFLAKSKEIRSDLVDGNIGLRDAVNQSLRSLNASHTYYLQPDEIEFYRIASVFQKIPKIAKLVGGKAEYPSTGILPRRIDGAWFVQDVLPKSSAEKSGVKIGDQLLKVDGRDFQPIESLLPYAGQMVKLEIKRNGQSLELEVAVEMKDPQAEFLQALKDSMKVESIDGKKVGYAHFYSYAGQEFQDALIEAISWGELAQAEALVLDLRYGMGGANIAYLNMFQKNIPPMRMIGRDGKETVLDQQWRKPAVILIDETARSGKETIAYGAKKLGLATLVGTPTAGAVVGGSPFPMPNGDLLYLAVADVLVDGIRLEHNPVQPDHRVEMDIRTCDGVDIQKEAALRIAAQRCQDSDN